MGNACYLYGKKGHLAEDCWYATKQATSTTNSPTRNCWYATKQGKCFFKDMLLDVLYDSGAAHSFISNACVERLEFVMSKLPYDVVVSTPTNNYVVTT